MLLKLIFSHLSFISVEKIDITLFRGVIVVKSILPLIPSEPATCLFPPKWIKVLSITIVDQKIYLALFKPKKSNRYSSLPVDEGYDTVSIGEGIRSPFLPNAAITPKFPSSAAALQSRPSLIYVYNTDFQLLTDELNKLPLHLFYKIHLDNMSININTKL